MNTTADDPEGQARIAALHQGLQEWGWTLGRNARIDVRWGAFDADSSRHYATELVALAPEVIVASASAAMGALQQMRTVPPIVFVSIIDPVGAGFVERLARPGGNVTGFAMFGVELRPIDLRNPGEIERGVVAFAREPNGGLIIVGAPPGLVHRDLIITLAARHRLPAVYPYPYFAHSGGLVSYGPDAVSHFRLAAVYIDRILKGARPAELPVEQPTKFELVFNLTAAKALGLEIPPTLLAIADEVIE
jgi:putative tryptophan/tyrosine transport system substrate-binding protein